MEKNLKRSCGMALAILTLMVCAQAVAAEGVVNINTASTEELALLPRVGPAVAGRIVEFREQNGKFEDVSDLLLVRGIGDKTFDLIEPYVALTGSTSLAEKVKVERGGDSPDRH